jgi:olfactory receptor
MSFFHFFGLMYSVLIAIMAYDRFVAICHEPMPLWTAGWWPMGVFLLLLLYPNLANGTSCSNNELPALVLGPDPSSLTYIEMDLSVNKTLVFIMVGMVIVIPFLHPSHLCSQPCGHHEVPSASHWKKAFPTCSSRLSVVAVFYGATIGVYECSSSVCTAVKE